MARRAPKSVPDVLAAVDLGSNSFHMVVARNTHGQLVILDRLREMVRLGAGLEADGRLNKEVDYCGSTATAPEEFISAVGLKNSAGAFGKAIEFEGKKIGTLVGLNDSTSWTPQQIGAWLETVIEGGEGSPFVRL